MISSRTVLLDSLARTQAEAQALARTIRGGECIAFSGALGAGKTTFIRFLCAALGAKVEASSPTYVLQHEYPTKGDLRIEHWDLYRIPTLPIELEERIPGNCVRLIEWAERFPELMREVTMLIELRLESETERSMSISSGMAKR
ncbi:MAG: tRNA (adenosine(37)-N6)-threonylcarbamoyltransferase complex ATPase subunit type 1 TsaE [Deltaproteobacteria bacterium]|nr:tRNA (adenosine(37)-N6)-threonylcarbamoyltransferase complex ATPase subunit type 1 TsaE [Deltaproteobacteria bacterium]